MKKYFNIATYLLIIVLVSACGKIGSKVITAKMLNTGSPSLLVATLTFDVAAGNTDNEIFPIGNTGFRDGNITAITISDPQYVMAGTSECVVGTTIVAGGTCNMHLDFTPGGMVNVSATMTIAYEGAGGTYTAVYPLEGTVH